MKELRAIACLLVMLMTLFLIGCSGEVPAEDSEYSDEEYETEESSGRGDYTIRYLQHGPLLNVVENATGKMGAMDPEGEMVIPFKYDEIGYIADDRFVVTIFDDESHENDKKGILDTDGKKIVPCEYADIAGGSSGYGGELDEIVTARKTEEDPVGYISVKDGSTVIEPKYEQAGEFMDDRAAVMLEEDKWGYIDREGNTVIEGPYSDANDFKNGVADVVENGNTLVIDRDGKELLRYEGVVDVISYSDGMAVISTDSEGEYSVVDSKGNEIVKATGEDLASEDVVLTGSLILVKHNEEDTETGGAVTEKSEIYDRSGKELFEDRAGDVSYANGRTIMQDRKTKKYGLLDENGKEIIPCEYHDISFMKRDKNIRAGWLDEDGDEYTGENEYEKDVIFVQRDEGSCFLADPDGNQLTEKEYQAIGDFSENGLAAVVSDGKTGFIDNTGNEVIPCSYADFVPTRSDIGDLEEGEEGEEGHVVDTAFFPSGFAAVSKEEGGSYALIESSGREITDYVYLHPGAFVKESIDNRDSFLSDVLVSGREDGKTVIIDADGKETVIDEKGELVIEDVQYGNGLIPVKKENDDSGLWALMDQKGNVITEYVYDVWLGND